MYELVENGLMVVTFVLGAVMVIAPKLVVKKSMAENKNSLLVSRILGALIAIFSVVVLLINMNIIAP